MQFKSKRDRNVFILASTCLLLGIVAITYMYASHVLSNTNMHVGRLVNPTQESVRICVTDQSATVTNLQTNDLENLSAQTNENIYVADNSVTTSNWFGQRRPFNILIGKNKTPFAVTSLQVRSSYGFTSSYNQYSIWAFSDDNKPIFIENGQCIVVERTVEK